MDRVVAAAGAGVVSASKATSACATRTLRTILPREGFTRHHDEKEETSQPSQQEEEPSVAMSEERISRELSHSRLARRDDAVTASIEPRSNGTKVPIGVSLRIRRTFDLRMQEESFGCSLHIIMRWESDDPGPGCNCGMGMGWTPSDWSPKWSPMYFVRNLCETVEERTHYVHEPNPAYGRGRHRQFLLTMEVKKLVRIFQTQDLSDFPFDVQTFRVAIEMEGLDARDCKFVPFEEGVPSASAGARSLLGFTDMRLHEQLLDRSVPLKYRFEQTNRNRSRRRIAYSALVVEIPFVRRVKYYIFNVAAIMFVICSFGFAAWAIPHTEVQDRLAVDFTLLLTAIAFKLLITDMLPRVDYFSKLDLYVLLCMAFLAFLIGAHCLVQYADGHPPTLARLESLAGMFGAHDGAPTAAAEDGGAAAEDQQEQRVYAIDACALVALATVWMALNAAALLVAVRLHLARISKGVTGDNEDEMELE